MSSQSNSSIIRGTSIVGSLTLVSRLLGFVREILVARLFGATLAADAYFVALRIPNLLRSIFAEGALTSAFVPVFTKELKEGTKEAQRAFSAIATLLVLVTSLITIFGILYADRIVDLFAPGFINNPDRRELCIQLTKIMFPYIIFVSFVALLNGALNSLKIFGISAWAQVIMNCVLIIGAYGAGWYEYRTSAIILAWSVLFGGIVQVISQLPALKRAGLSFTFSTDLLISPVKAVCALMIPAIFGAAVYQLTVFLNTQLASLLETGSVSWLSYADRLTQLPIGVFTIALASVLLPMLSHARAENNSQEFAHTLVNSLRYTSFCIIPTSVVLILFAEPLIKVMFERGQFDSYATHKTALAVQMYSFGLWAVSVHSMLIRAFNAHHDTRTPTLLGVSTLLSTLIFSLLFMGNISHPEATPLVGGLTALQQLLIQNVGHLDLGHAGLALAGAVSFYLTMTISLGILSVRMTVSWLPFFFATLKALIAAMLSMYIVGLFDFQNRSLYLQLLGGIPLFVICYLTVSLMIKSSELKETFHLLARITNRDKRSS